MVPAVLVLLGSLVSWLRIPREARGVVWAEDGWSFLQTWLDHPGDLVLFDPYEGYLHVVPRLVVQVAAEVLPAAWFAQGVTALCCLVVGGLTAIVYTCSSTMLHTVPARLALAAITVLAPAAPLEVLGNAANLHSYFMWTLPWVLLHRPGSRRSAWLMGALVLAAALTEVQVALFVPLLWLAVRDRRRWPVAVGLLLGVAAQALASLLSPRSPNLPLELSVLARVKGFLVDGVLSSVTGLDQGVVVRDLGWWVPVAVLTIMVMLGAVAVTQGGPARRLAVLTAFAAAVAVYVAAVTLNPNPNYAYDLFGAREWTNYRPPRYAVAPSMFLLGILVVGIDSLVSPVRRRAAMRGRRLIGYAALAVIVGVQLSQLSLGAAQRLGGEAWAGQMERREVGCAHRRPDGRVSLAISPSFGAVRTTCRRLLAWSD